MGRNSNKEEKEKELDTDNAVFEDPGPEPQEPTSDQLDAIPDPHDKELEVLRYLSAWKVWAEKTANVLRTGLYEKDRIISSLKRTLGERDEAIKGFQAWEKLKGKPLLEVYNVGDDVLLPDNVEGRIEQIRIGPCGVIGYLVRWWSKMLEEYKEQIILHNDLVLKDVMVMNPNARR